MRALLQTIWQADSGFPSGSFAFSYGIEGIAARHDRMDAEILTEIVESILQQRWASFDRVALVQAFRTNGALDAIAEIDRSVDIATFGEAMREGSRRNGASFLAVHARLETELAVRLRQAVRSGEISGHLAVMQGVIWRSLGLDERLAQAASGYAVASGTIAAAVRLDAVGALEGQKVLHRMLTVIDALSASTVPADAALSSFLPFIDIAAARHERADLRLFAN